MPDAPDRPDPYTPDPREGEPSLVAGLTRAEYDEIVARIRRSDRYPLLYKLRLAQRHIEEERWLDRLAASRDAS